MPEKLDPLIEITAAPRKIRVGNEDYYLSPLAMDDYADLCQRYIESLDDPVTEAKKDIEGLPADVAIGVIVAARKERRAMKETALTNVWRYQETAAGLKRTFYLSARHNHQDLTPEKVDSILPDTVEEILEVFGEMDDITGTTSGNSQSSQGMTDQADQNQGAEMPLGGESTGSLPSDMGGQDSKSGN